MYIPDDEWIYAPHLVFEARSVLASVRSFADQVHSDAYSIPSIATELGIRVHYLRDASLSMIGQCTREEQGLVISLNDALECTEWDMGGLTHELGHAVVDEVAPGCRGKLRQVTERNAWLRGIYVAISRSLAEAIVERRATVREVAARCCVPEPVVSIRVGLAVALGECDGDRDFAYERIRHNLLTLEQWFDDGRARGFREWAIA